MFCKESYSTPKRLKLHMKTSHFEAVKYTYKCHLTSCYEKEDLSFNSLHEIEKHYKVEHFDDDIHSKPFKCNYCNLVGCVKAIDLFIHILRKHE